MLLISKLSSNCDKFILSLNPSLVGNILNFDIATSPFIVRLLDLSILPTMKLDITESLAIELTVFKSLYFPDKLLLKLKSNPKSV